MTVSLFRLSDEAQIRVIYEDKTAFGSALSNRLDDHIRNCCRDIIAANHEKTPELIRHSSQLLGTAFQSRFLEDLYRGSGVLREDCLFPPSRLVQPAALTVERDGKCVEVQLENHQAHDLARWFGDWSREHTQPRGKRSRVLWQSLKEAAAFDDTPTLNRIEGDLVFIGHASVLHRLGTACILIDPFLLPRSSRHSITYQPITASELGIVEAILITHSHPDHFDLGSLMRLGPDVPIYVPAVERESILTIDMACRLEQLGFLHVHRMQWFDEVKIGSVRIVALPFYGEQPTCGPRYHPEVRNVGNVYVVETAERRIAFIAESGADLDGNVKHVAADANRKFGALTMLFGTHRGLCLYPLQLLRSSLARHLLFVPKEWWGTRQQIMNDAHDLLDTAEAWGAQQVVPYACGGAPWYRERGIGQWPVLLDGSPGITEPPPEVVHDAQRTRCWDAKGPIPSPVAVCVMHPGDAVDKGSVEPILRREPPHLWPYSESHHFTPATERDTGLLLRGGESIAVVRKKLLLLVLAVAEAQRRGIRSTTAEVRDMADKFRVHFGLGDPNDLHQWMADEGLDRTTFIAKMREFVLLEKLSEASAKQIDDALDVALRINTAGTFIRRRVLP